MRIYKNKFYFFLINLITNLYAQWSLNVSCRTYPSPYISDWATAPGIVNITITYGAQRPDTVRIEGSAVSLEHGEVVRGHSRDIIFLHPATIIETNCDFLNYSAITYNERYTEILQRTGRLLEGTYTLYINLVKVRTGEILAQNSCRFYILSFNPPSLISPENNDTIQTPFPTFQWTPVTTYPGFNVRYRIKICEMQQNQTPDIAINNIPYHEEIIENRTSFTYPGTARLLRGGKYVWQVQALDVDNRPIGENEGKSEIRKFIRRHPVTQAIPIPYIEISREITRVGNYFEIIFTITNKDSVIIRDLEISMKNTGFQFSSTGWMRGRKRSGSWSNWLEWGLGNSESYEWGIKSTFRWGKIPTFIPDTIIQIKCRAVPILCETPLTYKLCDSLKITFKAQVRGGMTNFTVMRYDLKYNNQDEVMNAFRSSDYLIVTSPSKLFSYYSYGQYYVARDTVNRLLAKIAELATYRNGVIGYFPPYFGREQLRNIIISPWGSKLSLTWKYEGYLLLVGEEEIVPAWNLSNARLSDYPYSNIIGDEYPELKVGRIIGRYATELIKPIQASIDVCKGGKTHDDSDALLVSGWEGTWEPFIVSIEKAEEKLQEKGVNVSIVHTEFYNLRRSMLEDALRFKGRENGGAHPNPDTADLAPFEVRQLAAWLLDSEGKLSLPPCSGRYEMREAKFMDTEGRIHRDLGCETRYGSFMSFTNVEEYIQNAIHVAESIEIARRGGNYGNYIYFNTDSEALREISRKIKIRIEDKDVIFFFGHGNPGSWDRVLEDNTTSSCPLEPIGFGRTVPIVIAISCLTGNYSKTHSIARGFLRNGVAVYIGATESVGSDPGTELARKYFWKYWNRGKRIGDALFELKEWLVENGDRIGSTTDHYIFNLYGDPKFGR